MKSVRIEAITATLAAALLGACASKPAPTTDPAPADPEPTEPEPVATTDPEPTEPAPTASTQPDPEPAPLPGERMEPIAGKMPATGSERSGNAACCGAGSCGTCPALPAGRKDPMPPKKPHEAQKHPAKSTRTGAAACCGVGTCGPC